MQQRSEFTEWIRNQNIAITDWLTRPTKLRSDVAKQEINGMNDLLAIVNDKRRILQTDFPAYTVEEPNDEDEEQDLERQLDGLERNIINAIALKQSNQDKIIDYRQTVEDINNWFNNLIRATDNLEEGNGLDCIKKLVAINKIMNEFKTDGPKRINLLKMKAADVNNAISNLDSQQVDEQMKSVERRYADIAKRNERKAQILENIKGDYDAIKTEIEQIHSWILAQISEIGNSKPLGLNTKSLENRILNLKNLIKESEGKQVLIDTLDKKLLNIKEELEPNEYIYLESRFRKTIEDQNELNKLLKEETDKFQVAIQTRKNFDNDEEKLKNLLKNKITSILKINDYSPLTSSDVENDIQKAKQQDANIKDMHENVSDLVRRGNAILKECPDNEKDILKNKIKDVLAIYGEIKDGCANKFQLLNNLLGSRRQFEDQISKLNNWIVETQISVGGELRLKNLPLLEEQLSKYQKLSIEAKGIKDLLVDLTKKANEILPELSNADKLKLNERIKNLKENFNKLNDIINERQNILSEHIRKYKDGKDKMTECMKFITNIQSEIKELSKPIGSKIEDVQTLLGAYENILESLKNNKSEMGDIQVNYFPELENILAQQDDMINVIEDQLKRLRQLLLLREQFIALVNEIITFIMKYTGVITDIEKSDDLIEDKIKRYDNVVLKIQECEATLAAASDKGQQIASEGSAADRNSITEQLQSLKQQLHNLRKAVEQQRQNHEVTLAEHKVLANELTEIMDWLHSKETYIKSRPLLDRDPDSVEIELQKYRHFNNDVEKYLKRLKKILNKAKNYENGMPNALLEMLSEGRLLLTTLPNEIQEYENYLKNNKIYRLDYMELASRMNAWIHEAEIRLQENKHGVDFENITNEIQEHEIFFGSEDTIKNLITKDIQKVNDQIWPSLNNLEQEELSRDLQRYTQVLKNTLNSAKSQRLQLDQDMELWKDYVQRREKVKVIIVRLQWSDEPVSNIAGIHYNIQKLLHIKQEMQVSLSLY